MPSHLRESGNASRCRITFGACFTVRSAHMGARVHGLLQLVVGRRSSMDVSRRRAGLAADSAQTTGLSIYQPLRTGSPPRGGDTAPRKRRACGWYSCCRRLSCVASLTDEWSTETQHNIALGNQVKSPACIAVNERFRPEERIRERQDGAPSDGLASSIRIRWRGGKRCVSSARCYCAATARGRALTTEALPEVISSWIHL